MDLRERLKQLWAPLIGIVRGTGVLTIDVNPCSLRTLFALCLGEGQNCLYVTADEVSRRRVVEELRVWQPLFPEKSVWEMNLTNSLDGVRWQQSLEEKSDWMVVMTIDDLPEEVEELDYFLAHSFLLRKGQEIRRETFLDFLYSLGYVRKDLVKERGELAIRGEVVDLFLPHLDNPVRTFWWGNSVERIRFFHPDTQRTLEEVEELFIPPANGFFRTVPWTKVLQKVVRIAFLDGVTWEAKEAFGRNVYLGLRRDHPETEILTSQEVPLFEGNLARLVTYLREKTYRTVEIVLPSEKLSLLADFLRESGLSFIEGWGEEHPLRLHQGFLTQGFALPSLSLLVLTGREIFGVSFAAPSWYQKTVSAFDLLTTLTSGEYVVHEEEGIGIFRGMKEMVVRGIRRVYLEIEYAAGDVLYVPVENAGVIQKYVGIGERKPILNRLGRGDWIKSKERAKKSVEKVARELVELYARRQLERGYAFPPDTPWQRELEMSFPFLETPDQKRAIEEVKRDMESSRPMDRLVCGDVGYGKTEVAIRAAFKAVMDGKQVAVLAPTTLLSEQHYLTFSERMKSFPVRIAVLNRFRSPLEQREILERVRSGAIDILIGTHRLLSKDVEFRDLGLLIIDEEQRFGVMHKERLKQVRVNLDVLTLTATPIPRTLYLSLLGMRDISLIETPPEGRKPIITLVLPRKRETIEEAIERELERGGQVFYVCPRIRDLWRVEKELREIFPRLPLGIAYGRLKGKDLEEVMGAFYRGEIPVLLCTTIVEIGLDVPRANTLIVDPATFFGLAQLYQLRGRIGRFDREAFAYFLYPRRLTHEAEERLEALLELGTTGSGAKLAMRDLEIRGAGNILGTEQHGFIQEIGFSLYLKLLQEEIARLRGEGGKAVSIQPRLRFNVEAYLPEWYIFAETERLYYYKRLWEAQGEEDIRLIEEEIHDRFGSLPKEVENLLRITRLRHYATITQVERIEEEEDGIYVDGPLDALSLLVKRSHGGKKGKVVVQGNRVRLWFPKMPLEELVSLWEGMRA